VLTGNQTASPFRFERRGKVRLRATNATRQYLKPVSPHENDCEDAIRHGTRERLPGPAERRARLKIAFST